jgi:hypothetical protein
MVCLIKGLAGELSSCTLVGLTGVLHGLRENLSQGRGLVEAGLGERNAFTKGPALARREGENQPGAEGQQTRSVPSSGRHGRDFNETSGHIQVVLRRRQGSAFDRNLRLAHTRHSRPQFQP